MNSNNTNNTNNNSDIWNCNPILYKDGYIMVPQNFTSSGQEGVTITIMDKDTCKCYTCEISDSAPVPINRFSQLFYNCVTGSEPIYSIEFERVQENNEITQIKIVIKINSEFIPYRKELVCTPLTTNIYFEGLFNTVRSIIIDNNNNKNNITELENRVSNLENRVSSLENTINQQNNIINNFINRFGNLNLESNPNNIDGPRVNNVQTNTHTNTQTNNPNNNIFGLGVGVGFGIPILPMIPVSPMILGSIGINSYVNTNTNTNSNSNSNPNSNRC